jgi:surface carbohydrate biosynthesis protein
MLIYLPVEVSRREMVAKIFTATILASKGYPVVVFKNTFFERNNWPSPGLYIGKNCFWNYGFGEEPNYHKMKELGIRVWHLDEEGGIYIGAAESEWKRLFRKRLNPSALRADDKIFAWGEWQRDDLLQSNPSCPVHITGSPNFDMLAPPYSDALAAFDRVETDGRENFILVNTRFSLSNGLMSLQRHLQDDSPSTQQFDAHTLRIWASQSAILQYHFISLVQKLSEALPHDQIILRPHPAENPEIYRLLLAGFSNVSVEWRGDVGSWIRQCRALIHNGCTTAVQAQFAKKPVISYVPLVDEDGQTPGLPNLIGVRCETVSAVIEALQVGQVADGPEVLRRTIAGTDAIDKIVAMVEAECVPPADGTDLDGIVAQVERVARFVAKKDARKRLVRRIFPKRRNENKGKKFDAAFFRRATEVFEAAKKHVNRPVEILAPHEECFLLLPGKAD